MGWPTSHQKPFINKQKFTYSRLFYSTFTKGKDESIVANFDVESEDTSKSPSLLVNKGKLWKVERLLAHLLPDL